MIDMDFDQICRKIKNLEIQGAENIARAAVKALKLRHDPAAIKKLISLRATEPCLRNAITFVMAQKNLSLGIKQALEHFDYAQEKVAEYGSKKIESGMTIFTHCHSSSVVGILRKAKEQGKKFEVYCTETRPMFQGRITASELAQLKIPVTMFVDSGARIALKEADLMLIGSDSISTEGKIINKIGSEMFSEIANKYDVPVYSCTDAWKFDPQSVYGYEEKIEKREAKEVWKKPPKGVKISNLAFEKVHPNLIMGIISELGIIQPEAFVVEVKRKYSWMF